MENKISIFFNVLFAIAIVAFPILLTSKIWVEPDVIINNLLLTDVIFFISIILIYWIFFYKKK